MKKTIIICSIIAAIIFHLYVTLERSFTYNGVTVSYKYSYGGKLTTKVLVENDMAEDIGNVPLYSWINPTMAQIVHADIHKKTVEIIPIKYNDLVFSGSTAKMVKETKISLGDYLRCLYVKIEPVE